MNKLLCTVISSIYWNSSNKNKLLPVLQVMMSFFPFIPSSFILDIETSCLEEKSKRDHFTQLVLACLVSCM